MNEQTETVTEPIPELIEVEGEETEANEAVNTELAAVLATLELCVETLEKLGKRVSKIEETIAEAEKRAKEFVEANTPKKETEPDVKIG